MYATSKLIIPPKPARDTPFIPKLRIRLRHSPNNPCGDHDQVYNISRNDASLPDENFVDDHSFHPNIEPLVDACSFSLLRNTSRKNSHPDFTKFSKSSRQRQFSGFTSGCNMRTAATKRKQSSVVLDTLDLENPDSLLTKVNLKLLINRETFSSLPVDVQQMLSQLLPLFDHCREMSLDNSVLIDDNDYSPSPLSSGVESSEHSNAVWLHPTALNNEFFTKALQDFSNRQAKGEFTPRIRNRAGLRAHVGNRYRYSSSSDPFLSTTNSIQNKEFTHEMHTKKLPDQTSSRRSSRQKPKNLNDNKTNNDSVQHKSIFANSSSVDNSFTSLTVSVSCISGKNSYFKRSRSTKPSHLRSDSNAESMMVCSPSPGHSGENLKKLGCSIESVDVGCENNMQNKTSSSNVSELCSFPLDDALDSGIRISVKSLYPADLECSEFLDSACHVSGGNRDDRSLSFSPAYNGTLVPPSSAGDSNRGLKLCDQTLDSDCLKLTDSPVTKTTPTRRLSLDSKLVNPSSNRQNSTSNSLRSARPSRSSNSNSSSGSPSMPPPRQTKTLAAMREKLRAKRLLKESERGMIGQPFYGLPGSMTPHPSSGSSGYFQNRSYPTPVNFISSSEVEYKHSLSVSSPPFETPMSSPVNDRNTYSVNMSSLPSETPELTASTLASGSPCSPHSAPSINVMSPLLPISNTSTESGAANNNLDSCTYYSNCSAQSYPSSPHLSNPNVNIILQHSLSSQSPSPVHPSQKHRFEQSVSAPPTPSNHLSEQNFTNYLHQPGHSTSSLGPCSSSSTPFHTFQVSPTVSFGPGSSQMLTNKYSLLPNVRPSFSDSHFAQILNHPISGSGCFVSSTSSEVSEDIISSKSVCQIVSTAMPSVACSIQATIKSFPSLDTISISPLTSVSSVTKLLTANSRESRSSTTTRAFFVDGDNLSEAVAFLQSLNPKATITQQQFLLIPGANKSQMILCRAPTTCSSEIIPPVSTQTSVSVSHANLTSWSSNPCLVTTPSTRTMENPPITISTPIVSNDVLPSTCITEKNPTSCSTSFVEPYRSNNFYVTQCGDGSLSKVIKSPELQIPRSLVYSKSINVSASNGPSFPFNVLISQSKALEANNERTPLLQVVKSVSSKVAISSSANSVSCLSRTAVSTVLNYNQPVSHSQLNVSLLTPGPSVINNDVPILFVQDRNQHPIRSQTATRPVTWVHRSSFDQHTDLSDRSNLSLPILSTATVITTHANNTGEFHCFPHPIARSTPSMQLSNSVSVSSHFGFQPIQSVQPSNPAARSLGSTPFLSGPTATIMSPCLPAVILSHPITIQSTSTIAPCQQNIFNRSLP
ncbi:hypothetical protein MN116_001238 [Schistosoma mekongi]|uniref:ASX DEUBAD domain-containing protein n=1 Tax=Schistosoma mekongi TaxID=38744 RepID=A0AAE2D9A3_SCHME|nr:hypothetical protein MN116_001238 [Schistosoma mekongi]